MLEINYFNPVVSDWNEEARERELREREECDFCLYCITPRMTGVYAISEVTDDSNKRPEKTIFVLLEEDDQDPDIRWKESSWGSLQAVVKLIRGNGAMVFFCLDEAADWLNAQ
jgi:hypothetical protein